MVKKNPKQTSDNIASKAGKALQSEGTPKKLKPIIASALAQAPPKKKSKSKKS